MSLRKTDIIFYKSGISGDGLGGPMHPETIPPKALHNVFNLVSSIERVSGKTKYRCIYMKNKNLTETAINPRLFIPEDTVSSSTVLYIGYDSSSGLGDGTSTGVAQRINNEAQQPANVKFTAATDPANGVALGFNIPPNMVVALWLKLIIFLGAEVAPVDGAIVKARFGNLLPQENAASSDVVLAITGETDSLQPFATTMDRIKQRSGLSAVVFTGNTTTSTDPTTWINMLGALKDRVGISFGPQDAKNTTMKNQLITELNTAANTKANGYSYQIIHNAYLIYMDITQTFTNPSPQFDYIKAQLELAKATAGIDFIIVFCNKAFYMTLAPNDTTLAIDNLLRTTYHQLFINSGVHLVISGQSRNYQRHHVLGFNGAIPDSPSTFFANHNSGYIMAKGSKNFGNTGCLFLNIGTGGMRPLHTLPTPIKTYTLYANALQNASSVGYLMLKCTKRTATRGATMLGLFFEVHTPSGASTPIETQRDTFALTLDTDVSVPTPTPPTTVTNQDIFGTKLIYTPKTGGTSWESVTWNGNARVLEPDGEDMRDPLDADVCIRDVGSPEVILHGNGEATVNGRSTRIAIIRSWKNVESTVYVKTNNEYYDNVELRPKTEHYCVECGGVMNSHNCFGGYIGNLNWTDESTYARKEKTHTVGYGPHIDENPVDTPVNTWIGLKVVCYTLPNNTSVKIEVYTDSTNGANGGTWIKRSEGTDSGNWEGTADPGIMRGSSLRTNSNDEDNQPDASYMFKKWSIKEINPPT